MRNKRELKELNENALKCVKSYTYIHRRARCTRRAVSVFYCHHYRHIDEVHRVRQSAQDRAKSIIEHSFDGTCIL